MTKRLAEVAKKAGVSEATVSRVLNGRNGVSESTRASVLTALDVLGYERPTKLRGERGRLVGLVLPELQNPIFPALAEVVTGALAQRGFTPALCARTIGGVLRGATTSRCCSTTRSPAWSSPAGRTRWPTPSTDHYRQLAGPPDAGRAGQRRRRRPGLPARLHRRRGGRRAGVRPPALARPRADRHGARPGGPHAVPPQAGRRWPRSAGWTRRRTSWSSAPTSRWRARGLAAARLIERGVTGMICASDVLALGTIRAARRLGLRGAAATSRWSASTTRSS